MKRAAWPSLVFKQPPHVFNLFFFTDIFCRARLRRRRLLAMEIKKGAAEPAACDGTYLGHHTPNYVCFVLYAYSCPSAYNLRPNCPSHTKLPDPLNHCLITRTESFIEDWIKRMSFAS